MRASVSLALSVCLFACSPDLDTERDPVDEGSFGTTVLTLVCKRIAYLEDLNDGDGVVDVRGDTYREICREGGTPPAGAPDPLEALLVERPRLIGAVDAAFPESFLSDLQASVTNEAFLSVYDDGTALAAVEGMAGTLGLLADDDEVIEALARLGRRDGYRPLAVALGGVRAAVRYPELDRVLSSSLAAVTGGGAAEEELDALLGAASAVLRNAEPAAEPTDPERTGALALDLLLQERALLGRGQPLPLVRRDHRGLARVDASGGFPAPFVDGDGDGLADTDGEGRFIGIDGKPVANPAPFSLAPGEEDPAWPYRDALGRALEDPDGDPVYDYVDLDRTLLGALLRDGAEIFAPGEGSALDLLHGARALMGPRQMTSRAYESGDRIDYRGFDEAQSALLDILYGYLQILRDPDIDDTLALAREVLREREAEIARLTEAIVEAARVSDAFPEAALEPGSPLWDDMMPVLRDVLAEPGLAEDLIRALENPQVAELGLRFADYMTYKDQFHYDPDTQEVVGALGTEVDRSAPDSGFNRSLMQRLLHLIYDGAGVTVCNKQDAVLTDPLGLGLPLKTYDECELIQIDDISVFFVQSIAYAKDAGGDIIYDEIDGVLEPRRKATLEFNWDSFIIESIVNDSLMEDMSGIDGFRTHPTPEALGRLMFLEPLPEFIAKTIDPPVTRFGEPFREVHAGSLPVWELNGFYEQMQPVVQPFADHDAEELFVDLLVVFHRHWPSRESADHQQAEPGAEGYAWASDVSSYEPVIAEVLRRRHLLDALVEGAPALNQVTANGESLPGIVADTARFVVTPRAGLTDRRGASSSETADGRPVPELSPWQILADAYQRKAELFAGAPEAGAAWERATRRLVDVFARGEGGDGVTWRFANPRFRGVLLALIEFLEDRLDAHAGDRDAWLSQALPADAEETFAGPTFAAAADLAAALAEDPEAEEALEGLTAYLVDELQSEQAFRTTLAASADLLQLALADRDMVPIARAVGEALRPERNWVRPQLALLQRAAANDENGALARLLRNLYTEYRPGHTPLGDILDGVVEVHRQHPYADHRAGMTAGDYRSVLQGVARFLDGEKRGLRKFVRVVERRKLDD